MCRDHSGPELLFTRRSFRDNFGYANVSSSTLRHSLQYHILSLQYSSPKSHGQPTSSISFSTAASDGIKSPGSKPTPKQQRPPRQIQVTAGHRGPSREVRTSNSPRPCPPGPGYASRVPKPCEEDHDIKGVWGVWTAPSSRSVRTMARTHTRTLLASHPDSRAEAILVAGVVVVLRGEKKNR